MEETLVRGLASRGRWREIDHFTIKDNKKYIYGEPHAMVDRQLILVNASLVPANKSTPSCEAVSRDMPAADFFNSFCEFWSELLTKVELRKRLRFSLDWPPPHVTKRAMWRHRQISCVVTFH